MIEIDALLEKGRVVNREQGSQAAFTLYEKLCRAIDEHLTVADYRAILKDPHIQEMYEAVEHYPVATMRSLLEAAKYDFSALETILGLAWERLNIFGLFITNSTSTTIRYEA